MKAFPLSSHEYPDAQGMDLRDYFAAKTIQGMFAADGEDSVIQNHKKAKIAYQMADLMMIEREK
jgi:hypothetical protein